MRNGKLMTTRVAAIALSSMMVLSPLTAFASSSNPNPPQIKDPYGVSIQDNDGFLTEAGGYINGTRDYAASFKKTLELVDIKNTDYIPSVPDVRFTYDITSGTAKDAAMEAVDSYNGAVVFAGDASKHIKTTTTDDLQANFSHTDKADGDVVSNGDGRGKQDNVASTMTRLVDFVVDEASFDGMDPGVYRFRLTERECIDLDENGAVETKTTQEDVKDDTEVVDAKYSTRYIDIAIGRATSSFSDPKRVIQGIILHEVTVTTYDGDPIKISKKKSEGYVPTSYDEEDENDKYTETGKPKHYSRYDTFDLLVDKELFGEGLTKDNVKKAYSIDVTLQGPVGTKVRVVKVNSIPGSDEIPALAENVTTASEWDLELDPEATKFTVELQNNEWFVISGLPSGALYTVAEQADDILSKVYTVENSKKADAYITMEDDNKLPKSVDHDALVKDAEDGKLTEANGVTEKAIEKIYKVEAKNEMDINNVLIINEQKPITVTGVVMNVAPYALMVIAAAIFAGLFISKKRQEEEI